HYAERLRSSDRAPIPNVSLLSDYREDAGKAEPLAPPGFGRRTAETFLSEVGTDVRHFPTARQLASWAALCPGNHESAGKQRTGRTRKGNPWLKTALVEAAHSASRAKQTYLAAQYHRLAARRGAKRAAVAA